MSTDRPVAPFDIAEMIGGRRGVVDMSIPGVTLVVVDTFAPLGWAIVGALGAAAVVTLLRRLRGDPLRQAGMGLLGLGNTLAMSVVRRTREFGVLRAVGAYRSQVRRLVVVEAATLSIVALVLAIPLGWLLSVTILRSSETALGVVIAYRAPWALIPAVGGLAVLSAGIASVAPARRASRVEPVTALRFE